MELLQRRKFCREFLNGYNEKLHPQIISRVFEIGLLTLKNTFNKLLFSKEELDEIIKSLSGKDYVDIVPLPPVKKLESLTNKHLVGNLKNRPLNKEELERNKLIKNQQMHRHFLQNPNFSTQNNEIYPFWWWNNKEEKVEEINKNTINNNINQTNGDIDYDNNALNNCYDEENNLNNINEIDYQGDDLRNEEIGNQINNYSVKKLNNSSIQKQKENLKNNKIIKNNLKLTNKPRVQSTRAQRNNNIPNQNFRKINNNMKNQNQPRKNIIFEKKPKFKYLYNNGRIIKIKGNNEGINYDMMNLTEPNNNY